MANDDYTPLPWDAWGGSIFAYTDQCTPSPDITFRTNTVLAGGLTTGNARRILACVRAMAHVSTEALEKLVKAGRELELALVLSQSFGKE